MPPDAALRVTVCVDRGVIRPDGLPSWLEVVHSADRVVPDAPLERGNVIAAALEAAGDAVHVLLEQDADA